jgi:hypothetical protein
VTFGHVSERDRNTDQEETWQLGAGQRAHGRGAEKQGVSLPDVHSHDSGHVERAVVANTLPLALEWLWRGFQAG